MWDYAKLSKDAKLAGGPRKFKEVIFNRGCKQGKDNGYKEGKSDAMIAGILATCILEIGKSIYDKKINRKDYSYRVICKEDYNQIDGTHPEDWEILLGGYYDNK